MTEEEDAIETLLFFAVQRAAVGLDIEQARMLRATERFLAENFDGLRQPGSE